MRSGLVNHFTLVELTPDLIDAAKSAFEMEGFTDRATFICGDYRNQVFEHKFDLVYFDNALHHMASVDSTIADMLDLLEVGGYFLMDDFVGPTYHQFSKQFDAYAARIRSLLPFGGFEENGGSIGPLQGLTVEEWQATDPSEACDSGAILPSIAARMPGARIIPTGGLVYLHACRDAFQELKGDGDRDATIIRLLFELDRILVRANPELTCYALAIYRKLTTSPQVDRSIDWKGLIQWPNWKIPI
jgi:SAM-dependent methyltransferase